MRSLVLGLPALLLCGCASNGVETLKPLEIMTGPYTSVVTAIPTGSLSYEHGCVLFSSDDGRLILAPMWPEGTVFNGTSVIFHKPGRAEQPIVISQEVALAGQPLTWPAVPGPRAPLFERQCGGVPFAVAEVRPAN